MQNTRVKICGLTRPEDAELAAELGADAIGINFFQGPRKVSFEQATTIIADLPPLISLVALLGDQRLSPLDTPADRELPVKVMVHMNYVQLYEHPVKMVPLINSLHLFQIDLNKYWLVWHIQNRSSLSRLQADMKFHAFLPAALLLDTASEKLGGTGQPFNWNWIAEARDAGELENLPPIILAGGLTPDNVADAIRIAKPYAVDVSSGVEPPNQPGIKDPIKMRDFIQAAKGASIN